MLKVMNNSNYKKIKKPNTWKQQAVMIGLMVLHCQCGKKCFRPNQSTDVKNKPVYENMTGNTAPNFEIFFSCRVKNECGGLCWWRAESWSHITTATHWPCMRCSSEGSENQVSSCLYHLYKETVSFCSSSHLPGFHHLPPLTPIDIKGHGNNLCEEWGCRLEDGNPFAKRVVT